MPSNSCNAVQFTANYGGCCSSAAFRRGNDHVAATGMPPKKAGQGRSPGSLAWAGLANTYYWIDPSRDVAGVILMQVLPFADKKCLEAIAGFETGVYAGLDATQRAA
jgi:CubicO group peptidase (beta-lactamase class C family)